MNKHQELLDKLWPHVTSDSRKMGGKICLRGIRVTLGQLLVAIAEDGVSIKNVLNDLNLEESCHVDDLTDAIKGLANFICDLEIEGK